jgi:hypothetical protein
VHAGVTPRCAFVLRDTRVSGKGIFVRAIGRTHWSGKNIRSILAGPLSAGFPTGATRGTDPVR